MELSNYVASYRVAKRSHYVNTYSSIEYVETFKILIISVNLDHIFWYVIFIFVRLSEAVQQLFS